MTQKNKKISRGRAIIKTLFVLSLFTLTLSACFSPWGGDNDNTTLTLYFGGASGSAKTSYWASYDDVSGEIEHTVTFSGRGVSKTVSVKGEGELALEVEPGQYDISVNDSLDGIPYAGGFASVYAKAGVNNPVSITMKSARAAFCVSPSAAYLAAAVDGEAHVFTAAEWDGTSLMAGAIWEVSGHDPDKETSIDSGGNLTIDPDEVPGTVLTITATHTSSSRTATAKVTVSNDDALSIETVQIYRADGFWPGSTLRADVYLPNPTDEVLYQWVRGGAEIFGATGQTYTITEDDLNKKISVYIRGKGLSGFFRSDDEYSVLVHKAVSTQAELQAIKDDLSGNYALVNNIDISGSWTPIGIDQYTPFTGSFDGNGKTINFTPMVQFLDDGYIGLFGAIGNTAQVKNFVLKGTIEKTFGTGECRVGFVAGENRGTIRNISVLGAITVNASDSASGPVYVGGIAGYSHGFIRNCYAGLTGLTVTAENGSYAHVGGIAGYINTTYGIPEITYCWGSGTIHASGYVYTRVGGITGEAAFSGGVVKIINCVALHSAVNVAGGTNKIGRIVGSLEVLPESLADNFGWVDMGSDSTPSWTSSGTGNDGADVSLENASLKTWWTNYNDGPAWSFSPPHDEENPWVWNNALLGRPVLWFEQ